jgi:site-specific recombinase XerD
VSGTCLGDSGLHLAGLRQTSNIEFLTKKGTGKKTKTKSLYPRRTIMKAKRRPKHKRNNKWGHNLKWACIQALKYRYGKGRYSTYATHKQHLMHLSKWLKRRGIVDIMQITREDLLSYARYVRDKQSNNYARNLISSANVIIESVRKDKAIRVEPSEVLPPRKSARTTKPAGMDIGLVSQVAQELNQNGQHRVAILILLTRLLGLRLKEACLLDLSIALRQAQKCGTVDVRIGTKGGRGRHIQREVPVSDEALEALLRAQNFCSTVTNSLIPVDMTSIQFMRLVKRQWRQVRSKYNLLKIQDLRSAFCCDRYHQLTGHDAPACNAGTLSATKEQDRHARDVIVKEIGHSNRYRMPPYIGRGQR